MGRKDVFEADWCSDVCGVGAERFDSIWKMKGGKAPISCQTLTHTQRHVTHSELVQMGLFVPAIKTLI